MNIKDERSDYIDKYCKEVFDQEPTIYIAKLQTVQKDDRRRLLKVEIGPKSEEKINKVILVVGATGAGKTTLINALFNYFTRIDYTDDFRMKLIDEKEKESQVQSQTNWITAYTINHQPWFNIDHTLTIIDTPGFGDTLGIERDKEIMIQMGQFFSSANPFQIDHLDMIAFVSASSPIRLTPTQHYILESVLSIFGRDIEDNISMMLTFADVGKPQIEAAFKKLHIKYQQVLLFNNATLFGPIEESIDSLDAEISRIIWKKNYKNFEFFAKELKILEPKTLNCSKEVLEKRFKLEIIAEKIQSNIKDHLNDLHQLRKEEQLLQQHQEDIDESRNFTYTETVRTTRKLESKFRSTNCTKCKKSCHRNYWFDFVGFTKMKTSHCEICENNCSWKLHTAENFIYEESYTDEIKTREDLESKYKRAIQEKGKVEDMIVICQGRIRQTEEKSINAIKEGLECRNRLREIALRPIRLTLVEYIDLLIAKEKTTFEGAAGRVRELQTIKENARIVHQISEAGENKEDAGELWRQFTHMDLE